MHSDTRLPTKVVNAAYGAVGSGLHIALALSGALLVAAGLLVVVVGPRPRVAPDRPLVG